MNLTIREQEILALIAEGMQNKEIAERLEISAHTVNRHVEHLMQKTRLHNRTQLAVWAVKQEKE